MKQLLNNHFYAKLILFPCRQIKIGRFIENSSKKQEILFKNIISNFIGIHRWIKLNILCAIQYVCKIHIQYLSTFARFKSFQ